ncbi:MAG: 4-alpha-glucanotransferase [Deltaproteobacteria bacterium]|nr:4-alpha-glucanotransferase [Deltaproteobacteria bacterium]
MNDRSSGILLHITSLPSPFGIGDLGPCSYQFADFLAETKQSCWQILPLNPTDTVHGNSPYHSASAFACNPLLISPELMVRDGFLKEEDLKPLPEFAQDSVEYAAVDDLKKRIYHRAYETFKNIQKTEEIDVFCHENSHWLDDYALFMAIKAHYGGRVWREWPEDLRKRKHEAIQQALRTFHHDIEKEKFLQFIFSKQWTALKHYCNEKGIRIIGDLPIYVVYDSVDAWTHPALFKLDDRLEPRVVAGVPPDYFSETGQLWGNPVYRWDVLKETNYDWWVKRIGHNLKFFDYLRIDHFRGFKACWEIPAGEENAVNGNWIEGPGADFFNHITKTFPHLPIIAEDLGFITPDVWELMEQFGFPGMKVLLFAFGDDPGTNPYAPHNHVRHCVVYTGTHDNNTAKGWFERELTQQDRARLFMYLGREITAGQVPWELIRLAMMSVAEKIIIPMQDILGLGEEARMNRPATNEGNWKWRFFPEQITPPVKDRLTQMTGIYGRS